MTRRLEGGQHALDDLEAGDKWRAGNITVKGGMVERFADTFRDSRALHLDDGFARGLGFPPRVSHSPFVLSPADVRKNNAPVRLDAAATRELDKFYSKNEIPCCV